MLGSLYAAWSRRHLSGASVSLLGVGLVSVPIYDMWDDITNLSWGVTTTFLENVFFLLLAASLVWGGVWLVRSNWNNEQVAEIARRTLGATGAVSLLVGWGVFTQLFAMNALKPGVLVLDSVLIGAVVSFGISVSSVRAGAYREQAERERALNERVQSLYEAAGELETARTHAEIYQIVEQALSDVTARASFRVVVDDEAVVSHGLSAPTDSDPTETIDIGDRGRIELRETLGVPETTAVELFASHLDETIQRVEREQQFREERDALAFINRTLRHDIMGDISLIQARLKMLERNDAVVDEGRNADHLDVALSRAEGMDEFVGTMANYMRSVLSEDRALDPVPLRRTVDKHVDAIRASHPDADIVVEAVPDVEIMADDLLDRVFVNLLRNALEHNDSPTPRVVIDGAHEGDTVRLRIADNGPGISEHRRAAIFEQGERGTESDGTGFGLYLVKDVVESYGGDIRVRDNEPRGTVFELFLPVPHAE
mgnify:CR=1 FL=1